ncbi:MAG: hypothetical protein R3E95_07255 [Thiolinea sp.]
MKKNVNKPVTLLAGLCMISASAALQAQAINEAWVTSDQLDTDTLDNAAFAVASVSATNSVWVTADTLDADPTNNYALAYTVNSPPAISSDGGGDNAVLSLAENSTAVTTVVAVDADGDTLSYSISGGVDAARFTIGAGSGVLAFATAPDFENPVDANTDNAYNVEVTVADGNGGSDVQVLSVTVTNGNDAPVISSDGGGAGAALDVAENSTAATTVAATDEDGDTPTYSITGGADAARFTVDINTGALAFAAAPDFENPTDADGNNIYEVEVTADDGNGGTDVQALAVTVMDVIETIRLQVRALLQGAYRSSTRNMADTLRENELLPVQQPYSAAFNPHLAHAGNEQADTSLLTSTDPDNAPVDWVLVELRDATDPTQVQASQAALLQRDGDVMAADSGTTDLYFGVAPANYYVAIRHRNHLGAMTQTAPALSAAPVLVDFSDPATETWGTHARMLGTDVALLMAGDINHDGKIVMDGPGNDLNALLVSVLADPGNLYFNANYILPGYLGEDLNLDGLTIFSGHGNEANLAKGNVLLHEGNTTFSSNYIINEQIPE